MQLSSDKDILSNDLRFLTFKDVEMVSNKKSKKVPPCFHCGKECILYIHIENLTDINV